MPTESLNVLTYLAVSLSVSRKAQTVTKNDFVGIAQTAAAAQLEQSASLHSASQRISAPDDPCPRRKKKHSQRPVMKGANGKSLEVHEVLLNIGTLEKV